MSNPLLARKAKDPMCKDCWLLKRMQEYKQDILQKGIANMKRERDEARALLQKALSDLAQTTKERVFLDEALQESVDDYNYASQERDEAIRERDEAMDWIRKMNRWNNDELGAFIARMDAKERQEIDNEPAFGMSDGEAREAARIRAEERHARKEKP